MLHIKNISKTLGKFRLNDISFSVEEGEYFVALGFSGVGKTVLLETIAGIIMPDSGSILFNNMDITFEPINRRKIGIVFQDQTLFPHLNVFENIAYSLKNKLSGAELKEKVKNEAEKVGIFDKLERMPETLSGGEYQRASLARTLITGTKLLLLDEPLSSLDAKAKIEMRALLRKLNREGITIIHVTHDYEEAVSLASRIAIIENGKLVQTDKPEEIFRHPKSEFVAKFIGIKNFYSGILEECKGSEIKLFKTNDTEFRVLTDFEPGLCSLIIGSENITVSKNKIESSAQNCLAGKITDIAPARLGIEITVKVNEIEIVAILTKDSALNFGLNDEVFVSFKASTCKIV